MTANRRLLGLIACGTLAATAPPDVGTTTDITLSYQTGSGHDGGRSSSSGHSTIREQVVAVRDGGVELSYDLPPTATADERQREWLWPARVLRAADGTVRLLDRQLMIRRRDAWLARGGLSPAMCGRWVFTWAAFKIECEPEAALAAIAEYDIVPRDPVAGTLVSYPAALAPAPLARGPGDGTYAARLAVDPAHVRRSAAEVDVVAGEIMRQPVSRERALRDHADDAVVGTIDIVIETDARGAARQRTRTMRTSVTRPGQPTQVAEREEIIVRKPVAGT